MKTTKMTLAQAQASFLSQAPSKLAWTPEFMTRKPRAQRTQKNAHPEEDLQISCCRYLDLCQGLIYWATPNSIWVGEMTPQKMNYLAKLKRLGVKKGLPDLSIIFRNEHGALTFCWAELKAANNKPTEEQESYMDKLNGLGGFTAVVKSLDDMHGLLVNAGYPKPPTL